MAQARVLAVTITVPWLTSSVFSFRSMKITVAEICLDAQLVSPYIYIIITKRFFDLLKGGPMDKNDKINMFISSEPSRVPGFVFRGCGYPCFRRFFEQRRMRHRRMSFRPFPMLKTPWSPVYQLKQSDFTTANIIKDISTT